MSHKMCVIPKNATSLQSNVRRKKVDTVRDFPEHCGPVVVTANSNVVPLASSCGTDVSDKMCQIPNDAKNSHSNVRCRKVDIVRDFPEHCGPLVITGESTLSGNVMKLTNSDEVRSVAIDVRKDEERCLDNCMGVGEEIARDDESKCCSFEEKWKHDIEKLSQVVARAKEYINSLNTNRPSASEAFALGDSECISEGKISTDPLGEEKRARATALSSDKKNCAEICVADDISQGSERIPIRAMNGVDDESPSDFHYITRNVYPFWFQRVEPVGCDCTDGCFESHACSCLIKNKGKIPYNEKGEIVRVRPIVHECGPQCKCPPSCINRVGQHGQRHELEIFKSESRGWGVRSRTFIPSGSFICEYLGELLRDKDAEERVVCDEYLFDVSDTCDEDGEGGDGEEEHGSGYTIDAAKFGNVGRFINHSCSPNLYAQKVLYDHEDPKIPHLMFFAIKSIPPLRELFYDYNYKMDRVCDNKGNIRKKKCFCGSRKCTGRMY